MKEATPTCATCIHHTVCAVYRPGNNDILAKGESCSEYLPNDMLRQHALKILKEFSKSMWSGTSLFGAKVLSIDKRAFEAIRHEFLDRK